MKERPILFKSEMVRAILEGRKTQTRRIVKTAQLGSGGVLGVRVAPRTFCYLDFDGVPGLSWRPVGGGPTVPFPPDRIASACPYGVPKDHLWVKETWTSCQNCGGTDYRADVNRPRNCGSCDAILGKWKPSIFMPRLYSRITLDIVNVRVEKLQEISGEDAIAEGISIPRCGCEVCSTGTSCTVDARKAIAIYRTLWESINGKSSWEVNPWVWVIGFKRIK